MLKQVSILGIRGIPARHGGFETFAEHLALYLVSKGWKVTVYCQCEGQGSITEDSWHGVRRIHVPVSNRGAFGTVIFDWKSTLHAVQKKTLILTLGYNTALFCTLYRIMGLPNLINMDGIEWRRKKWSWPERIWLYVNERLGCWLGNHLIADHPEIKRHLCTRVSKHKISMIPYGADMISTADIDLLAPLGLEPRAYALIVARLEPENSILEIISAFSLRQRGCKLAVLGKLEPDTNPYHCQVVHAASSEVMFLDVIYDKSTLAALRYYCRLHIHGHQVGGTNPSLVEALGAGSAVLAHDNCFNHWVAGSGASYFSSIDKCAGLLDRLLVDHSMIRRMREASLVRFREGLSWGKILSEYEHVLTRWSGK